MIRVADAVTLNLIQLFAVCITSESNCEIVGGVWRSRIRCVTCEKEAHRFRYEYVYVQGDEYEQNV